MANHIKIKETLSEQEIHKSLENYTKMAKEAVELLKSKDPSDKEKAINKLHEIKETLMQTVYSLTDKLGLPRDQIEEIIKDPASFLSSDALAGLNALKGLKQ